MDNYLNEIYSQIGALTFSPPSELHTELQRIRFGIRSSNKLNKLQSGNSSVLRGRKTKFSKKNLTSKKKKNSVKNNSANNGKAKLIVSGIKDIAKNVRKSADPGVVPKKKKKTTKKKNVNNNNDGNLNINSNVLAEEMSKLTITLHPLKYQHS